MASNPQVQRLLDEIYELGKTPEEVCRDCPELLPEVRQRWRQIQLIDAQVGKLFPGLGTGSDAGTAAPPGGVPAPPAAFGRYQVRHTLGAGGFGTVDLGHDTQLDRPVAIKVRRGELRPRTRLHVRRVRSRGRFAVEPLQAGQSLAQIPRYSRLGLIHRPVPTRSGSSPLVGAGLAVAELLPLRAVRDRVEHRPACRTDDVDAARQGG